MKRILAAILITGFLKAGGQVERVRVMEYNLLYYRASSPPCSHTFTPIQRDQQLQAIVQYTSPDIFIVNEMGANSSNPTFINDFVLNTNGTNKFAHANFSNNGFSSIANMLFFDQNKFALFHQTAVTKDLNGADLTRIIDIYTLYYKDPKLAQGADTIFFTIAAAHLKAGNSSADANKRAKETEALMEYFTHAHSVDNVIMAGDLNLYTSSETAYQNLLNPTDNSERLNDPINMPGPWNNNSNFAGIHTQSTHSSSSGCHTSGGMDDRFDFILLSDEIMNGNQGISYVLNSYEAIGQDGNHFNASINSGSNGAVPSNIADALYDFSDHLPVTLELDIQLSNIGMKEIFSDYNIRFNNPVSDKLNIEISKVPDGGMQVQLMDIMGRILYIDKLIRDNDKFNIPTSRLADGVYVLNFIGPNGSTLTKKIVKS